jgi:hypothetical protein
MDGVGGKDRDRDRAMTEWIEEQTATVQSEELSLHRLEKIRNGVMNNET